VRRRKWNRAAAYGPSGKSRRRRRRQVQCRRQALERREEPRATAREKIAVLLELVRDPAVSLADIVLRAQRSGVMLSVELVQGVFEQYDLKRSAAP